MEFMNVRESVKWFSEQMESKLKENDKKGGWDNCNIYWLIGRLKEETNELLNAVDLHRDLGASKENIIKESADVANFAMMIADIARKHLKD
jgi:NTP pyrophosphatase (non-canonical NTP hydrolase)